MKLKRIYVCFLLLCSCSAVLFGITYAYINTKALGFGDYEKAVCTFENDSGDRMLKLYDNEINLSKAKNLSAQKIGEAVQGAWQYIEEKIALLEKDGNIIIL